MALKEIADGILNVAAGIRQGLLACPPRHSHLIGQPEALHGINLSVDDLVAESCERGWEAESGKCNA